MTEIFYQVAQTSENFRKPPKNFAYIIQVCSQSSSPTYSNGADDETPFFPLAGPVDYRFEIRKTDPTLTYYLLETSYDWQSNGVSSVPDEVGSGSKFLR